MYFKNKDVLNLIKNELISISLYLLLFIFIIVLPLVIIRHFLNQQTLINTGIISHKKVAFGIKSLNILTTLVVFFLPFFLIDFDTSIKNPRNSMNYILYFTIYYLVNLILLSIKIYNYNHLINIDYLKKKFIKFQFEIYSFALITNLLIIITENNLTKSMYNTFTFLVIFDTLILKSLELIKQYIHRNE